MLVLAKRDADPDDSRPMPYAPTVFTSPSQLPAFTSKTHHCFSPQSIHLLTRIRYKSSFHRLLRLFGALRGQSGDDRITERSVCFAAGKQPLPVPRVGSEQG